MVEEFTDIINNTASLSNGESAETRQKIWDMLHDLEKAIIKYGNGSAELYFGEVCGQAWPTRTWTMFISCKTDSVFEQAKLMMPLYQFTIDYNNGFPVNLQAHYSAFSFICNNIDELKDGLSRILADKTDAIRVFATGRPI